MDELTQIENELVPVYETSTGEKVVYGSELHKVLGVRSKFADWIKNRLNDCEAIENKDFETFSKILEKGRPSIDYIIKLDTAKEMAMLERNEKGKQVHRYFIQIEKKYKKIEQAKEKKIIEGDVFAQVFGNPEQKENYFSTSNFNMPKIKVWNGQRVVTFKDIDKVHQRPEGTAKKAFSRNRKRFIKGVDYFIVTRSEIQKSVKDTLEYFENIPNRGLTVLTETGYLMVVKPFTDDLSWEVQRQLVTGYFKGKALEKYLKEQTQVSQSGNYPLLVNKWMHEQEPNFKTICKAYDISRKELYHKILLDIGDDYNVDDYRACYKRDTGHAPEYIMDVVSFYPELRESAEIAIEIQ